TSHAILANRVSFLLGLNGPSAPIDTACSSSLVAIHRALESIHTGSSDMAIVGGVQVMLTPAAFISFGAAGLLSEDGKTKSFDARADGYVRGEGSGAIFLKPLDMAEADGNHIYAVIKATAENHGGRATMLTAPNPTLQAELLIEAYQKAEIDPTTVGYIECHGTGTSLGDPIEFQAMKKAFSELYKKHQKAPAVKPHIGLSSVKSNIGHLETAAGISGVLKVLLALKHKQIPALLHFEQLNSYVNLEGTPFYIVDKTMPWEAIQGANGNLLPRVAGVSSFGFGGANAHIIFEEYLPVTNGFSSQTDGSHLIILSAKNEDRLKAYAQLMLTHVEKQEVDLANFAYTLQVGRDEMPERFAVVVSGMDDLKNKLAAFLKSDGNLNGQFRNNTQKNKGRFQSLVDGKAGKAFVQTLIEQKDFTKLAELWAFGVDIDWRALHIATGRKRMSLPTYPFARERCWPINRTTDDTTKHHQKS
ncbi:MAG: type I polyketide synthase, partial [Moraxellaceae bacterium]